MVKKRPDLCMLCGGSPCTCDGSKKKRSSKRTVKVGSAPEATSTTEKSPSSTPSDSDTENVYGEIPEATSRFKSASPSEEEVDLSYFAALRVLRPLLNDVSKREVDRELRRPYPQSVDRRIADWKSHVSRTEDTEPPEEETGR
jgi:hypothetical protein